MPDTPLRRPGAASLTVLTAALLTAGAFAFAGAAVRAGGVVRLVAADEASGSAALRGYWASFTPAERAILDRARTARR